MGYKGDPPKLISRESILYLFGLVTMHWYLFGHDAFGEPCYCAGHGSAAIYDVSVLHRGCHSFCSNAGTVIHRVRVLVAAS